MMHSITTTRYQWELARYPLDIKNQEPTETIIVLPPWSEECYNLVSEYLDNNPADGFYYM